MSDENKIDSNVTDGISDRVWLGASLAIVAIAAFLRFFWLGLKPLHHDEGVNGHFLTTLFREGVYRYDPSNYHGPDLYYISLVFTKLFGLNTLSVRWSVAIFGLLTVVLALYLRRYIGSIGSLAAALFLALSPGMVYISRYFIHEIIFVFFSLAIVVAVLFFLDKRRVGPGATISLTLTLGVSILPPTFLFIKMVQGISTTGFWIILVLALLIEMLVIFFVMRMLMEWKDGRTIYLILAAVSAVMLYATKETAFITHGTMAIAVVCVIGWFKLLSGDSKERTRRIVGSILTGAAIVGGAILLLAKFSSISGFAKEFYSYFSGDTGQGWLFFLIALLGVFSAVSYLIYFWSNKKAESIVEPGFWDSFDTWTVKDWSIASGLAIVVFGFLLVTLFTGFLQSPGELVDFFRAYAFWAKTSASDHTQSGFVGYVRWMLHVEAPLVFLSVLGTMFAVIRAKYRFALFAGLWAFGLFLAYSIISYKTPWLALSFTLPMAIVAGYALEELVMSKDRVLKVAGLALAVLSVLILSFQTYDHNFVRYDDESMPYVYAHTRRGFEDLVKDAKRFAKKGGKGTEATVEVVTNEYWPMPWYFNEYPNANFHGKLIPANTAEIIIAHKKQKSELPERYGRHYKFIKEYPLRPGVELYLLVRSDLAGDEGINIYEIP